MSKQIEKATGVIDGLIPSKNSGFIKINDSDEEFYFLASQLANSEYETLEKGQSVSFVIGSPSSNGGRRFANNVEVLQKTDEQTAITSKQQKIEAPPPQLTATRMIEKLLAIFDEAKSCSNPDDFEDSVFILLRCLGIHRLYQFDRKNQAGKADGFFIVENFAVMYDCTLRDNFEEHKKEQIENYVNKLNNKSQFSVDIKQTDGGSKSKVFQISGKTRHVWIITRNTTRELNDYDGIKVKEVCIDDLIKVLATRLFLGIFEEEDLSTKLTLIDRTN